MNKFSRTSLNRLATCHPLLQELMTEVLTEIDIIIICGHRDELDQNEAYRKGNSKLKYPLSKHNQLPSLAVDIAPHPLDWEDIESFRRMAEVVKRKARELGINIVWGGDWKTFKDYPHFELTVNY